jgi:hypothetical protein
MGRVIWIFGASNAPELVIPARERKVQLNVLALKPKLQVSYFNIVVSEIPI